MTPLLIPLADLPGPLPAGAPVLATREAILFVPASGDWRILPGWRGTVVGGRHIGWTDDSGEAAMLWDADEHCGLALDLSPPPLVDGYPTRIDGLTVAASMLARAMGLDPTACRWHIKTWAGGGWWEWRLHPVLGPGFTGADTVGSPMAHVPALASIDPQHPDAARLAMVAVLRARPWVTQ